MKEIKIKELEIKNFCGYAKAKFVFDENENLIYAPTGFGKTTILTAVKSALGFIDDKIYPTIDGYKVSKLETSVNMLLKVDEYDYNLSFTSNQKWKNEKFVGNNIVYNFDNVKCTLKNYKEKISDIFRISYENILKLVDISFFNTDITKWKWSDRRKFLYDLLDIDSKVENLIEKEEFDMIRNDIKKGKDETDIQKELNAEKKRINDLQTKNKVLIEDKNETLSEYLSIDFNKYQKEQKELFEKLSILQNDTMLNGDSEEIKKLIEKQKDIDKKIQTEECLLRDREKDLQYKLNKKTSEYCNKEIDLEKSKKYYETLHNQIEDCEIEICELEKTKFDDTKSVCPTCKRRYTEKKIANLKDIFETQKTKNIQSLNEKLEDLKQRLKTNHLYNKKYTNELMKIKQELESLDNIKIDYSNLEKLKTEYSNLIEEILKKREEYSKKDIEEEIIATKNKYDEISKILYKKQLSDNLKKDIEDFKKFSRELAQEDTKRINKQNELKNYIVEKVNIVNEVVNEKFEDISFKFFKLNGANAENPFDDDCECVYKGKVYSCCSTGQKNYANILTHKNLCKMFDINCFTIIDDMNLCTLENNFNNNQTIKLYTSNDNEKINIKGSFISNIYTIEDCIK